MKTYTILLLLIFSLIFMGCEAMKGSCITVAGGKGDIQGEITYCFSSEKTQEHNVPVVEGTEDNGNSQDFFGFDLGQLNSILDKIRGKEKEGKAGIASVKSVETKETSAKHPVAEILELIQKQTK